MTTLRAEKRDMNVKAKKLRHDGFVPANLSGKDMKESMPLQIAKTDAEKVLKKNKRGAQVTLQVSEETITAMIKDLEFNSMKGEYTFVEFQLLVADEKVSATTRIMLINEEEAKGIIQQELSEISYRAFPADLIEKVEIDVAKLTVGDGLHVGDLEMSKNDKIELITPSDMMIVNIAERTEMVVEAEEETPAEA